MAIGVNIHDVLPTKNCLCQLGYTNVLAGICAGVGLTTGGANILIGSCAGCAITSGFGHIVIGGIAGTALITGGYNTFIGFTAGRFVTGSNNIFIGALAGNSISSNLTGTLNIGIGYGVGQVMCLQASENTAIGSSAGGGLRTGSRNFLIGTAAGSNITSGNCNIQIGHCSAWSSRVPATANSCIDFSAGYSTSATTPPFLHINSTGIGFCHASPAAVVHICGCLYATDEVTAYYSDKRLKENIRPINDALQKVILLNGVTYNPNRKALEFGFEEDKKLVGVLADEVETVLPEIVVAAPFDITEDKKSKTGDNYKTVQYERLVPLLVEGIKELKAKTEELRNKINAYKKTNQI
jgi:hypothetical protein